MNTNLPKIKLISRIALGLVWFYEGLVPKVLFLRAAEIDLVRRSHPVWQTPELTLQVVGVAQMLVGLWLIIGMAERAAVLLATAWMLILTALIAGRKSLDVNQSVWSARQRSLPDRLCAYGLASIAAALRFRRTSVSISLASCRCDHRFQSSSDV